MSKINNNKTARISGRSRGTLNVPSAVTKKLLKVNLKVFWSKVDETIKNKGKKTFFFKFFKILLSHVNVNYKGTFLAPCVLVIRSNNLPQFNLERINQQLTRVVIRRLTILLYDLSSFCYVAFRE